MKTKTKSHQVPKGTKINVALLRRVMDHIEDDKRRFVMDTYCEHDDGYTDRGHACGTVACIAGWALLLSKAKGHVTPEKVCAARDSIDLMFEGVGLHTGSDRIFDQAKRLLRLTLDQATRLFFHSAWPAKFKRQRSDNVPQAIDRIHHFIETNGAE